MIDLAAIEDEGLHGTGINGGSGARRLFLRTVDSLVRHLDSIWKRYQFEKKKKNVLVAWKVHDFYRRMANNFFF